MMFLRLKECDKCGGDLSLDRDKYGWFWLCFQCGKLWDVESREAALAQVRFTKLMAVG